MIARPPSARRSIRSALPCTATPSITASPLTLGLQRPPALGAVGALLLARPSGSPRAAAAATTRAASGGSPRSSSKARGARHQLVGVALVLGQPLLEHLVDRAALPRGAVVGVDRVEAAQAEDRLRVESERVGLEPVDRGHRDPARPLLRAAATARGRLGGLRRARVVERRGEPLEPRVAREPAGHRPQPQPEARGDGRRAAVAPGAGDQHAAARRARWRNRARQGRCGTRAPACRGWRGSSAPATGRAPAAPARRPR